MTDDFFAGFNQLRSIGLVGYDELAQATAKPIEWRWYGIMTDTHQTEVCGPSGGGKTTLVMLLACALAADRVVNLLGRDVEPITDGRRVVIIEQENGAHSLREKLRQSCEALGLDMRRTVDRMAFFVRSGLTYNDVRWKQLRELGKTERIGALIIDTRATVLMHGESNNEDDQAEISRDLMNMITEGGYPTITLSHSPKDDPYAVSGSTQRKAGVDNLLNVLPKSVGKSKKVTGARLIFNKLRDNFLDDHPDPIEWSLKRQGPQWVLQHDGSIISEPLTHRVLRVLGDGAMTRRAISEAINHSREDTNKVLTSLFDSSQIEIVEVTVSGMKREGIRRVGSV